MRACSKKQNIQQRAIEILQKTEHCVLSHNEKKQLLQSLSYELAKYSLEYPLMDVVQKQLTQMSLSEFQQLRCAVEQRIAALHSETG